jgi:hypothetical protein
MRIFHFDKNTPLRSSFAQHEISLRRQLCDSLVSC